MILTKFNIIIFRKNKLIKKKIKKIHLIKSLNKYIQNNKKFFLINKDKILKEKIKN